MTTKAEIRDYFAKFGKQGGKKRAQNMTPEERKAAARKAVEARWAKQKAELRELAAEITKRSTALEKKATARAKQKEKAEK
jgi:hypothetical protein